MTSSPAFFKSALSETLELAEGAYSQDAYSDWMGVAALLLGLGYSPKEAAAILLSKWMRYAADERPKGRDKATASDLQRYLDEPYHGCTHAAVAGLVAQTY